MALALAPDERKAAAGRGGGAVVLIAFVLLGVHIALYGDWIIDDAGITFAYARNLATGHGLVSQPGMPHVEGFTDLLWALLLAATMRVGCFDLVCLPKVLGWAFGCVALFAVAAAVGAERPVRRCAAVAAIVTAANPALRSGADLVSRTDCWLPWWRCRCGMRARAASACG